MSGSDPPAGSTAPTLAGLLCAKRERALLTRPEPAERAADGADRIASAAAQLIADVPCHSHGPHPAAASADWPSDQLVV
jgi:hypothetical protein